MLRSIDRMLSMGLINGKVAILTCSGRAIGAATAKMFAAEGEEVQLGVLDRMRQMARCFYLWEGRERQKKQLDQCYFSPLHCRIIFLGLC
jgi:NAD(P)-dependent dehydrogenase (short-subunit alcohol dehydrogenase family)